MHRKVCWFLILAFVLCLGGQASAQAPDPNCGSPNLLMVVDTSGSMLDGDKITGLTQAIKEAVTLFKADLRYGLISFSNGQAIKQVDLGPADKKDADAHAKLIFDKLANLKAIGDTPMTAAMRMAQKTYEEAIPNDPLHKDPDPNTKRPSYVLLMTDGEPTDGDPKPIILALRKLTVGSKIYDIKTFVVGFGSGQTIRSYQLDQYAKAGGTGKFFHATSKEDLIQVFKTISKDVSRSKEICNGRDDDCDGVVDEDVKRDCKSDCGVGVEICNNGQWQACTAPKVKTEVCDGHDNNCDGQVDEGLTRNCSNSCGQGEQACIHGDWSTCTAPRPEPEVCDGKDNDCNGQIDEGAQACPGGKCIMDGNVPKCDVACKDGECPAGFLCNHDTGKCRELPCRRHKCAPGLICVNRPDYTPECVDPCQGVTCPEGQTCGRSGKCINCYESACPPQMICQEGKCIPDKCANIKCPPGQGCRDGACFDTCAQKQCPNGQKCQTVDKNQQQGICVGDPCFGTKCDAGEYCEAGRCVPNKCASASAQACGDKQLCDPETGRCYDNPCAKTHCPEGTYCDKGECKTGSAPTGPAPGQCQANTDCFSADNSLVCKNGYCVPGASVKGGSGSCGCTFIPGQDNPVFPIFLSLFLFAFVIRRKRTTP